MANFVRNLPNECREVVISKYDTRKSVQEYIISSNQERKVAFQINQDNVLLQIADLVSWSIYRFYEFGDAEYFDLIKEFVQIKPFIRIQQTLSEPNLDRRLRAETHGGCGHPCEQSRCCRVHIVLNLHSVGRVVPMRYRTTWD